MAFAAAVRADTMAACALHDAGTGRGGVYHLFRLPVDIEQEIHRLLTGKSGKIVAEDITPLMGDMDGLTNVLRGMAVEVPGKIVGPWRAGNKPELQRPEIYGRLAGAYLRAIETGEKIYPYVEDEKSH